MLVVMNRQLNDRAAYMRRDSHDIGAHVRIVGPGIEIVEAHDDQSQDNGGRDDRDADHSPGYRKGEIATTGRVNIRHLLLLKAG